MDATIGGREAIYRVKLPPSRSLLARSHRLWSILFSGGKAVDILGLQAQELKGSYDQLRATRERLRRELAEASHREQERIAADLEHHLVSKLGILLDRADSLTRKLELAAPDAVGEAAAVRLHLEGAISLTRDLARGLDPIGHGGSLEEALGDLAERTRDLCGISCEFSRIGSQWIFARSDEINLYRLAQEAVNNSIRHGHANHIRILLASADGLGTLTITDDGVGIRDIAKHHAGIGTKIMRYRAEMMNGTLQIESDPGRSTTVSCILKSPGIESLESAIPNEAAVAPSNPIPGRGSVTLAPRISDRHRGARVDP